MAAAASAQSRPIPSRAAFLARIDDVTRGAADGVSRPPRWGGYRIWAERVELWVGQPGRAHDRAVWTRALSLGGRVFRRRLDRHPAHAMSGGSSHDADRDRCRAPRLAWPRRSRPDRYLVPIPDACLRELDAVVAELRKGPVPTLLLEPAHFQLEACARLMATVRTRLDEGAGVVVLDRLPLDRMSASEAVDVYWLLANFLEPPVAQEWKGTVIYDVRHDGGAYGEDTRGALTPVSLEMHTDSSMGEAPPNYLGLLCLETAKSGGMSIVSSALAAHNHFLETAPASARAPVPGLLSRPSGVPGG